MQVINDQKENQWKLRRAKLISCCTTSTVQSQKFSSNTIATRSIVLLKLQINLLSNNYIFHNYLLLHFLKLSLSYLLSFPSHLLHKYQATDWKTIIIKNKWEGVIQICYIQLPTKRISLTILGFLLLNCNQQPRMEKFKTHSFGYYFYKRSDYFHALLNCAL